MFERLKQFFGRTKMKSVTNNNVLLENDLVKQSYYATSTIVLKQQEWISLYEKSAEVDETLGLPAAICSELARLVTLELQFEVEDVNNNTETVIKNPVNDDKKPLIVETRAGYINRQLKPIITNIKRYVEYACAGGGLVFKPIINGDKIEIDINYANQFIPLAFNNEGLMTSVMFLDEFTDGNTYYHRYEHHELNGNTYKVTNTCYKSNRKDTRGKKCSLSEVNCWEHLSPETILGNVKVPLFVYFKIPDGNCLDMTSPLGVSSFYRSMPQIEQADKQWKRYLWEFESGERIMEASEDAFDRDEETNAPIVPEGRERLFWITKLQSNETNTLVHLHSPEFREVAQKAALNTILQRVEFNSGLAYGTLSDPSNIDKTATEIKTSKQRSYSTVTDIQHNLDKALRQLVDVIDIYCDLYSAIYKNIKDCEYSIPEKTPYNVTATWDDSIIVDSDTERTRDLNEVRQGLMLKWEYRVKWYGEDEETAKQRIAEQESKNAANNPFNFSSTKE